MVKPFQLSAVYVETPIDLGVQSVKEGGQSLVFAETRNRSKSLATKAADVYFSDFRKKRFEGIRKNLKKDSI